MYSNTDIFINVSTLQVPILIVIFSFQVLQSMIDDNARPLEEILQLSVNVHLDGALVDPSLYATHIKTLDTLTGLGFQLLSSTAAPGGEIYEEPLLNNRMLPLQYKLTYVRI